MLSYHNIYTYFSRRIEQGVAITITIAIAITITISITIIITISITKPVRTHTTLTPHDPPNDQAATVPLSRGTRGCALRLWSGVCVDTRVIGW